MFLRHSNDSTRFLAECGASIEEYTAIQPVGSKYDYFRDPQHPIEAVAVIVEDKVYSVFRVVGIERIGSSYEIASPNYVEFDRRRQRPARECRYFRLEQLPCSAVSRTVRGWERRTRTPVQRHEGSFFNEIEVDSPPKLISEESFRATFHEKVLASARSTREARHLRLQESLPTPRRVEVISFEFVRNPDVVAEVLDRARGYCERCKKPAPFLRRIDGMPYLEVHHRTPLAFGGLDTVGNAEALCPNCHRQAHYGNA